MIRALFLFLSPLSLFPLAYNFANSNQLSWMSFVPSASIRRVSGIQFLQLVIYIK